MNREEGLVAVREVVADSLGIDPREVTSQSRLVIDLAANSLDIIDLVFSLERRFGLKLRNAELDRLLRGELFAANAVVDGFLKPEAVDRLARVLPGLAEIQDRTRVAPKDIVALITVEALWRMVETRILAASPPHPKQ